MEQTLFFLINHNWTSPQVDWVMATITNWNFWMPFLLCVCILLGVFGSFHARAALACAIACVVVVDSIVHSLKHCIGRPRPYMVLSGVRKVELEHVHPQILALTRPLRVHYSQLGSQRPLHGHSFPSGHAANSFALATIFALFFRRLGWIFIASAALVAYSRVYVGAHWPLDVAAASLIGAGTALALAVCVETLKRWLGAFSRRGSSS
ncbi:MAG: phosphatase PAP2 family protein [Candidatus Xiphinematobacter sp.]|nr:MAG: phosphatase PAP2 family protein [Candidatus Xiphinematobacter sp.]